MIAVLISGAIRNLAETWPENKKYLDELNHPYDVFVHSWTRNFGTPRKVYKDRVTIRDSIKFRELGYFEKDIDVSEDCIETIISNSFIQIESFQEKSVITNFGLSAYTDHPLFRNLLNSVAMYQGISRVFESALNQDAKPYVNFVRLRTDFLLSDRLPLEALESDIYFGGPGVNPGFGYVSDQFFIVKREVAKKVALCERNLLDYVKQNGWGLESNRPFYGERILSKFLCDIRIDKQVLEGPIVGAIKRPIAVPISKSFSGAYFCESFQFYLTRLIRKFLGVCIKILKRVSIS